MDIIGLLVQKIMQLLLIMLMGYTIVRCKMLKAEDSRVLSKICLYLIAPCTTIKAFQITLDATVMGGFIYALTAALVIHILLLLLLKPLKAVFKLDIIETASVFYSNGGNLIIPIVSYLFGDEWVIYTNGFIMVQTLLLWTHGVSLFQGQKTIQWKSIFLNINLICIAVGFAFMLLRVSLPQVVLGTLGSVGAMLGPCAMLITGMLAANMPIKKVLCNKRTYLPVALRLVLIPGLALLLTKVLISMCVIPAGDTITLIVLLAVMAPSASNVVQLALLYNCDAEHAGAINILSTVLCTLTMPAMACAYLL